MPNRNYVKGRRKEYRICKELKKKGFDIVQRSAGSHSPIDVFAISKDKRIIKFIQSKPEGFKADKIFNELLNWLKGDFKIEFEIK